MGRLVSVVLVTWNSAEYLPRCLAGVAGQTHRELELIVVDNASTDGSADIAPPAIRNTTNRGFSAAVNQALALAKGEFALLLNPDAFLEPEYVERLVAAIDAAGPQFGMATGRLIRGEGPGIVPTNEIDSLGMRMTRSGRHLDIMDEDELRRSRIRSAAAMLPLSVHREDLSSDREERKRGCRTPDRAVSAARIEPVEIFGPSGAAALHRMEMLRDVAIFGEVLDEDFFAYREDADLAWRARLFGWRAIYVPDARAVHVRKVTPERRGALDPAINMHSVKNRFLLRIKNEGAYLALRNALFEIPRDLLVLLAVVTIERSSIPGIRWIWRNRARVLARRHEIQKRRRVSDRELARWFR